MPQALLLNTSGNNLISTTSLTSTHSVPLYICPNWTIAEELPIHTVNITWFFYRVEPNSTLRWPFHRCKSFGSRLARLGIEVLPLDAIDQVSLSSPRTAIGKFTGRTLDILVNNSGPGVYCPRKAEALSQ